MQTSISDAGIQRPLVFFDPVSYTHLDVYKRQQYNNSYNELNLSFANNVNTPDGGTHEEGFKSALTRVFNDFGREKGYICLLYTSRCV